MGVIGKLMKIEGRVWKFGSDIDTDAIIPARYLNQSDPKELAKHVMEDERSEFLKEVKKVTFYWPIRISAVVLPGNMRPLP